MALAILTDTNWMAIVKQRRGRKILRVDILTRILLVFSEFSTSKFNIYSIFDYHVKT